MMETMIVCNCCGDDKRAPISRYLLENLLEQVIDGVKRKADEAGAKYIMFYLPQGVKPSGLSEFEVAYGKESLVTCNPFAIIKNLNGSDPQPLICDGILPVYQDRKLILTTPEETYIELKKQKSRLIYVINGEESKVVEATVGSRLSQFVSGPDIKAVLIGGIRGKFINPDQLDSCEVDESSLYNSITIYDKMCCMVSELEKLMEESWQTSCGKCVLCREGTLQYKTILQDMITGKAKLSDMELMNETGELIKIGAYCSFGKAMPQPFMTAMELFGKEFEDHIKKKNCFAGVCYQSETYIILPKQCIGCGECVNSCEEDAIEGKKGFIHMIDEDMCEGCGKCIQICEKGAIVKLSGPKPRLPRKLTKVGKF